MADSELAPRLGRIDEMVAAIEQAPDPRLRATASELVSTVLELHRIALERLLQLTDEGSYERIAEDATVSSVLVLHGLHPATLEARIAAALEEVRPSLHAHKGDIEVVSIEEPVVKLRLSGTCDGCPSSTITFRNLIEKAVRERAPEIESIEVEGLAPAQTGQRKAG